MTNQKDVHEALKDLQDLMRKLTPELERKHQEIGELDRKVDDLVNTKR